MNMVTDIEKKEINNKNLKSEIQNNLKILVYF